MKKKISYLILLIALFLFTGSVYALECRYSDGSLTAEFTIKNKDSVSKATVKGTLESSNKTKIDAEVSIHNWDKIFNPSVDPSKTEINSKGQDYYINSKDCPPLSIFVDRKGVGDLQFDFAVFTKDHENEFEDYGKKKQGYAILPLVYSSKKDDANDPSKQDYNSCAEFTTNEGVPSCENNTQFSCIWNETKYGNYCNTDNLMYVSCGGAFDIPYQAPQIINFVFNLLKIGTPIILIIVSIIQLLKSLAASKEDEIKKAQSSLVKKMIAAALVFFIASIVQLVVSIVADSGETEDVSTCMDCFLNNSCSENVYYKTNVGGTYMCTYLNGDESDICEGNK